MQRRYHEIPDAERRAPFVRLTFVALCLFMAWATVLGAVDPAWAAEAIGQFSHVEGKVDLLRNGALPAVPVKDGDSVQVKDVIRTKSNARAVITFKDGNILRLAERSRMDITEYLSTPTTIKGVIDLPRGKVMASVERKTTERVAIPQGGNKFEIRTPNAVAGVRGTEYIVAHNLNVTVVLVKDGAVNVYNPKTPTVTVTVTAGNTTSVAEGKVPQLPRPAKPGEIEKNEKDTTPTTATTSNKGDKNSEGNNSKSSSGSTSGNGVASAGGEKITTKSEAAQQGGTGTTTANESTSGETTSASSGSTSTTSTSVDTTTTTTTSTDTTTTATITTTTTPVGDSTTTSLTQTALTVDTLPTVDTFTTTTAATTPTVTPTTTTTTQPVLTTPPPITETSTTAATLVTAPTTTTTTAPTTATTTTTTTTTTPPPSPLVATGAISDFLGQVGTYVAQGYSATDGSWLDYGYSNDVKHGSLSRYDVTAGTSSYTYYQPDGTFSTLTTDYTSTTSTSTSTTGTWDPTVDMATLFSVPTGYTQEYSKNGAFLFPDGVLNGVFDTADTLWTSTSSSPASAALAGAYIEPAGTQTLSRVWVSTLKSSDPTKGTSLTPDGGFYAGYLAGSESSNAMDAMLVGISWDPSSNVAWLQGTLSGTADPTAQTYTMAGSVYRGASLSLTGIPAANAPAYLIEQPYGYVHGFAGTVGSGGTVAGEGTSYYDYGYGWYGWYGYGMGSSVSTMAIAAPDSTTTLPFGLFSMQGAGTFVAPTSGTSFQARLVGSASFGASHVDTNWNGMYTYADKGGYSYWYDTATNSGSVSYYRPGGANYSIMYNADGTYTKDDYTTGTTTSGTWTPANGLAFLETPPDTTYVKKSTGRGYADGGMLLANLSSGTWSNGKITGSMTGKYLTMQHEGTLDGSALGNYSGTTWEATAIGTWNQTTDLLFASSIASDFMYVVDSTPYAWVYGVLGGTQTLWSGSPVGFKMLAAYYPWNGQVASSPQNFVWSQSITPQDVVRHQNLTYDNGTYYGYLSGIGLTASGQIKGALYALSVDPTGNTGILKGTYSGTLYPDVQMIDVTNGTILPIATNGNVGTPTALLDVNGALTTNLHQVSVQLANNFDDSHGIFANGSSTSLNEVSVMANRADGFTYASLVADPSVGVWLMNSGGAYNPATTTSVFGLFADKKWSDYSSATSSGTAHRLLGLDRFGTWQNGEMTGNALGYLGDWETGSVSLLAGQTLGVYNDGQATFGATSLGVGISVAEYLPALGVPSQKAILDLLGMPTTLLNGGTGTAATNLSGTQPSLAGTTVAMQSIRLLSSTTSPFGWPYLLATDVVSGNSASSLVSVGGMLMTNATDVGSGNLPTLYARFNPQQDENNNWLAYINGIGVITTDAGYEQGTFFGAAAGTRPTSSTFSGSAGGLFYPSTFLSHITDSTDTAYLWGDVTQTSARDGYFVGMLAGDAPLQLWGASQALPDAGNFDMLGAYVPESGMSGPRDSNHIFGVSIVPTNYTVASHPHTTTDGGSYVAALLGIEYTSMASPYGRPMEGLVGGLYVDPTGKTGVLGGQFSGLFDANNVNWWGGGTMTPVQLGSMSITDASTFPTTIINDTIYDSSGVQFVVNGTAMSVGGATPNCTIGGTVSRINDPGSAGWGGITTDAAGVDPGFGNGSTWDWALEINTTSGGTFTNVLGMYGNGSVVVDDANGNGHFTGQYGGYYGDITNTPNTGITVGEVIGVFNPNTSFQQYTGGVWMETTKLLAMAADTTNGGQATLAKLNIPAYEVGRANLSGSGNNLSVAMNNVVFLASTATATVPQIWATQNVSGTYSAAPALGTAVPLTGNGLSVGFTPTQWDATNNKWIATVAGSGTYTGTGTMNNAAIQMKGVAAGTLNAGSLAGTAAGVVR